MVENRIPQAMLEEIKMSSTVTEITNAADILGVGKKKKKISSAQEVLQDTRTASELVPSSVSPQIWVTKFS